MNEIKQVIKDAIFNYLKKMNRTFPLKPGALFIDQQIFISSREASQYRGLYKEVVTELIAEDLFIFQERTESVVSGYKITELGISKII